MNGLLLSLLCGALIWLPAGSAHGVSLGLAVVEQEKSRLSYTFESTQFEFREGSFESDQAIPQLLEYAVQGGKLLKQGAPLPDLLDVAEVLYQCQVEGMDFVVVRIEKNSMSSPAKLLSAMAGHPVQRSTVVALQVDGAKVLARRELISRDSSYRWQAKIYRVEAVESKP